MRSTLVFLAAALLVSCTSEPPSPDKSPSGARGSTPPAGSEAPGPAAAAPAPSTTVATSAEAPTGLTGEWEGHYDAKKGAVLLPPRVKDVALDKDDGKKLAGKGTLSITVDPAGKIIGKNRGALGPGLVTGRVDDGIVRASINPEDPTAPNAMTGVFVALQKGEALVGEIRVAGPDATVVREAPITLTRK
jgi:hypothetical protein